MLLLSLCIFMYENGCLETENFSLFLVWENKVKESAFPSSPQPCARHSVSVIQIPFLFFVIIMLKFFFFCFVLFFFQYCEE